MRHAVLSLSATLLSLPFFIAGCSGTAANNGAGGSGNTASFGGSTAAGGGGPGACSTTVTATTASDYSFSSTITMPLQTIASKTEFTVDWSTLTKDFMKHPLAVPGDVDSVFLVIWHLDQATLEQKLNNDAPDLQTYVTPPPSIVTNKTKTSAKFFEFTLFGTVIDQPTMLSYIDTAQYPSTEWSYTLMVHTGTDPQKGTRMIQAFKTDPTSTNTVINITDNSTDLRYTANLHDLQPLQLPAGQPGITIDWSTLTMNGLGHAIDTSQPSQIDHVMVGHYPNLTIADLEMQFLDLDRIHTGLWQGDVASGTSINLGTLKDSAGQAFPGIDAQGLWVVAASCSTCANPAPWYLTILKPCSM